MPRLIAAFESGGMDTLLGWWGSLKEFATSVAGTMPFLPDWLRYFWKNIAPVVLAFLGGALLLSLLIKELHPRKAEIEQRVERQARARTLVQEDGWTVLKEDENSILLSQPARPAQTGFMGAAHPRRLLVRDDEVIFDVIVIYDRASWKLNDPSSFEQENGSAISLRNLFADDAYQRTFGRSRDLICIGLASNSKDGYPVGSDHELSQSRAANLCRAIYDSVDTNSHSFWITSLGMALDEAESDVAQRRQRTAIVIGMDGGPDFNARDEVPRMIQTTTITGVDLNRYSRSGQSAVVEFDPNATEQAWP